jgi:hypothetical protein
LSEPACNEDQAVAASTGVTAGVTKTADDSTPVNGGTLLAGIPDNPDHRPAIPAFVRTIGTITV